MFLFLIADIIVISKRKGSLINVYKVYPTMITPYTDNMEIDYAAVKNIVDWYAENGCSGIFAVCQSSEMNYLSLKERIKLAESVLKFSDGRMNVVASGHVSSSLEQQAEEINEIAKTSIDAFILVSNRFDINNDGDNVWIENAERVLSKVNPDIKLGIYECPIPYKRLLSKKLIDWCIHTKRFKFIKDTCCDFELLKNRIKQLENSGIELYNANSQSLLHSLRCGGAGYSGVMANFHPDLYVWLCDNFEKQPQKAELIQSYLCMSAFLENLSYPVCAKYKMNLNGVKMNLNARSKDRKFFINYQKEIIDQQIDLEAYVRKLIK